MATKTTKILHKRGKSASVPRLEASELAYTIDTQQMLIGTTDGNKALASKEDLVAIRNTVSDAKALASEALGLTDQAKSKLIELLMSQSIDANETNTLNELIDKAKKIPENSIAALETLPYPVGSFSASIVEVATIKLLWSTPEDITELSDYIIVYNNTHYPKNVLDGEAYIVSSEYTSIDFINLDKKATYYFRIFTRNAKKQPQTIYKVATATTGLGIAAFLRIEKTDLSIASIQSAVDDEGYVYTSGFYGNDTVNTTLYKLDPDTLGIIWEYACGGKTSVITIHDGNIYLGAQNKVLCLNKKGSLILEGQMERDVADISINVDGNMAVSTSYYYGSATYIQEVYRIPLLDFSKKTRVYYNSKSSSYATNCSAVIDDENNIYLCNESYFYSYDKDNKKLGSAQMTITYNTKIRLYEGYIYGISTYMSKYTLSGTSVSTATVFGSGSLSSMHINKGGVAHICGRPGVYSIDTKAMNTKWYKSDLSKGSTSICASEDGKVYYFEENSKIRKFEES